MKAIAKRLLDLSAVSISALCLVHCLALPVLAAMLPLANAWVQSEWVHAVFVLIAAPLSALALLHGGSGHRAPAPWLALAGLGVALLALGAAGWPDRSWETPVTVVGSLCLATVHLWNWRRHSLAASRRALG
jgi:hypothetical protein